MIEQTSVKSALKVNIAISSPMATALQLWSDMYQNQAEWLTTDVKSLNLAAAIAGEIARAVTIELEIKVSGDARAKYLQDQLSRVVPKMRQMVEFGAAKGGLMFKPFVNGKNIDVDFVQADQFYPVSFDANGNIVSCVFADQRTKDKYFFTRLEYHAMVPGGCLIKNMVFRSTSQSDLGIQVSLDSFDDWKDLQPEATITGIEKPLFAYFKYPLANNIDPTSPLGVSCYARAVDLIKDADIQWSNLIWEFESGQRALYADVTAFQRNDDGDLILPQKRLYRALNESSNIGEEGLYQEWSPEFREASILSGLDAILKKIEYSCGLAYGTISDPQVESKTATEIKISKQRTYATITDTQKSLQNALDQLIYAMDTWATLSKLSQKGSYSVVYDFDDSVVTDKDLQFTQDLRVVQQGIMGKVEFRMRNYGEDLKTATEKINEAKADMEVDVFKNAGS